LTHTNLEDPTTLFSLDEVLGKGTFAAVYRAIDRATRLPVAVKRVFLDKTRGTLQSFVVCISFTAIMSESVLQSEIQYLSLCHHPNITGLHGAFVYESELWIVMEFVGPSTTNLLRASKTLPEPAVAVIMHEGELLPISHCPHYSNTAVLSGLQYLHSAGHLHLDIKPSNILVSAAGDCKICDFGVCVSMERLREMKEEAAIHAEPHPWMPFVAISIVCLQVMPFSVRRKSESEIEADKKSIAQYIGTPLYMAPEISRQEPHSPKCDIWSLGISCIELLTGVLPRGDLHVLKVCRHHHYTSIVTDTHCRRYGALCTSQPPPLAHRSQLLPRRLWICV
jgi:serine/threonine-protein kinase 24/25/MST4